MSHVFISYSRKNEQYARKLADSLRNEGFDVWIDNDSLRGGHAWWPSIVFAIRDCAAVCVVMSEDSAVSRWVRREITLADKYQKPIFPIWLNGTLDIPLWEMLVDIQPVDVREGKTPPLTFYGDLRSFAPQQGQQGSDVTAPVEDAAHLPADVKEELVNPLTPEPGPSNLKLSLMLLGIVALIVILLVANYALEQVVQYQRQQQETAVAIDLTNQMIATHIAATQAAANLTETAEQWTSTPSITPTNFPSPTPLPPNAPCTDTGVDIQISGMGSLIRTGPGDEFSTIRRAEPGEKFQVTGIAGDKDNTYYRVVYDDNAEGWVFKFFVYLVQTYPESSIESLIISNPEASAYIGNFGVLVRSGPSEDYETIEQISSRWVTITGKNASGDYYLVNYGCQSGWVLDFFISRFEGDLDNVPIVSG